jgi:ketosteroid isomerase-like protein
VREAMDQMQAEYAAEDVEAILAHYSDHYVGAESPFTKSAFREELEYFFRRKTEVRLECRVEDVRCAGDLARATVSWQLSYRSDDERVPGTRQATSQLMWQNEEGTWRVTAEWRLATDETAPTPGTEYRLGEQGFAVQLPAGWESSLMATGHHAPTVNLMTDDLQASLCVGGDLLPTSFTAEQLSDIIEAQTKLIFPEAAELKLKITDVGDIPAVIRDLEMPRDGGRAIWRTIFFVRGNDFAYVCLKAQDRKTFAQHLPAWKAMVKSLRSIEKTKGAAESDRLIAKEGVIEQGGVRVTFPRGWKSSVRPGEGLTVFAESPDGTATILFWTIELMSQAPPAELLSADHKAMARVCKEFKLLKCEEADCGPLRGARSVSTFDLGGSQKRLRHYFVCGDMAYIFVCDARPAEAFERWRGDFEQTIASLQVKDAEQ